MGNEFQQFLTALKRLYKSVLGFEGGTDIPATIEGIKRDISFRGQSSWILIFSILIASIGLNVNSVAVIIGAMLISPLMGPIVGMGLGIGTNDFETIGRSLKNIGIAVALSLITSTLYFLITPLDIEQTELIARTKPTILDVLVALFGGFAGIIAGASKQKSNVIPGVAIATALMPPLCTAGYGLATWQMTYFFGAFYLFFINSVFISLSTFIVVRYLKFPLVDHIDAKKLRRNKIILSFILLLTIVPSSIIFIFVIQEARFNRAAEHFVKEQCMFDGSELITHRLSYNDTLSQIDLYYIGEHIGSLQQMHLRNELEDYGLISNKLLRATRSTQIVFHQERDERVIDIDAKLDEYNSNLRLKILEDLYTKNDELIKSKDQKIELLEDELVKINSKNDTLPYAQIGKELQFHFPTIDKYSYAQSIEYSTLNDTMILDTIPVFLLRFKKGYKSYYRKKQLQKTNEWLILRLGDDAIRTLEY